MPPTIEIWSSSHLIVASKEGYAAFATHAVEDVLKELVNDWTASQEL
jgi:hypothetical protein